MDSCAGQLQVNANKASTPPRRNSAIAATNSSWACSRRLWPRSCGNHPQTKFQ